VGVGQPRRTADWKRRGLPLTKPLRCVKPRSSSSAWRTNRASCRSRRPGMGKSEIVYEAAREAADIGPHEPPLVKPSNSASRTTKIAFFAPRTRNGLGFPAGAAFSQNYQNALPPTTHAQLRHVVLVANNRFVWNSPSRRRAPTQCYASCARPAGIPGMAQDGKARALIVRLLDAFTHRHGRWR
jgi:hypothetical protein